VPARILKPAVFLHFHAAAHSPSPKPARWSPGHSPNGSFRRETAESGVYGYWLRTRHEHSQEAAEKATEGRDSARLNQKQQSLDKETPFA